MDTHRLWIPLLCKVVDRENEWISFAEHVVNNSDPANKWDEYVQHVRDSLTLKGHQYDLERVKHWNLHNLERRRTICNLMFEEKDASEKKKQSSVCEIFKAIWADFWKTKQDQNGNCEDVIDQYKTKYNIN